MANRRLDAAYAAQGEQVRSRIEAFTRSRFAAGQYRDADLERFVSVVVPQVLASRRQMSALTDAYLARVLTDTLGRPVRPRGPIDTDLLRGVAASEVYARPFVTVRTKLSQGMAFDAAVRAGAERLADIVLTDMQLAKTHTAQAVFTASPVQRYARVLTGNENCGMCAVASTNTYKKADLLPIHPGCDCGVRPLAPDEHVSQELLPEVHALAEEHFGVSDAGGRKVDYRKLVTVREHGELGPVLTVKGQEFTGPSDLSGTAA